MRTNEFLVGEPTTTTDPTAQQIPWELREWRRGDDGQLHLALSKQALDPSLVQTTSFQDWLQENRTAVLNQVATLPEPFLAVTSSENGSRISLFPVNSDDFLVEQSLNKMGCAGCHTTETNSVFTHVGERWNGTGKAKISDFLRQELPKRARNLLHVSLGNLDRARPKPVH